jgi:transposase-like protein
MSELKPPSSLLEATRFFADPDRTVEYVASLRWPDGPVCPRCDGREHSYLTTRRVWKCKACKKQFSVKVGTIFEDSAIPLDKWMIAIWLIANSKNGISSHELGRALGITQKSAWFVNHRIRLAMESGSFEKFDGEVEVDETYVGGKALNMHKSKRDQRRDKAVVVGAVQRGGKVRAAVVELPTHEAFRDHVAANVERTATVYTDAHPAYESLWEFGYKHHGPVNHSVHYVDGSAHTNTIENFWSLLKRGLHGTYISVEPFHLGRYVEERLFAYNERKLTDQERFHKVLGSVAGRRLTWAELTESA